MKFVCDINISPKALNKIVNKEVHRLIRKIVKEQLSKYYSGENYYVPKYEIEQHKKAINKMLK